MLEVNNRITHLAGGAKVTKWEVDRTMPEHIYQSAIAPYQIIEAGFNLRQMGLLPDVRLENYVDPQRAQEIKLFLEVSGLSIGNLSAWEEGMYVTGSGFNKGDLKRDQIVRIKGFNEFMDGTMVWATNGVGRVKPSVETFDQLLVYYMGLFMNAGLLKRPSLEELLNLARDSALIKQVSAEYSPIHQSIIHLHVEPNKWNRRLFNVVRVNEHLVQDGKFHSSCGTRPLALYTTEEIMRGTLENRELITVALLPNHGIFIASPFNLPSTVKFLNPVQSEISFGKVNPA